MLIATAFFPKFALVIHVVATVAGYGVLLVYPLIAVATERVDKRALPALIRARLMISRMVVDPGMVLVVASGIYLAFDWHLWGHFVVIFGIAVALIIGGLEGAIVASRTDHLATLAERDVQAAGDGEVVWSEEFLRARTISDQVNAVLAALVIAVVVVMVVN